MADAGSTIRSARTVGRVRSFDGETMTVLTPTGKTQSIATNAETLVFRATEGTVEDVHEGDRIVVTYHADSPESAQEIIVLSPDDSHGLPILEVDEEWITVKGAWGGENAIYLGYSRFDVVTPVALHEIGRGTIVYGFLAVGDEDALTATELITLPEDTTFGS